MKNIIGQKLLDKYFDDTATEQERAIVEEWYASTLLSTINSDKDLKGEDYNRIKSEIWTNIAPKQTVIYSYKKLWLRTAAAAALFISLGIGGYYFYQQANNNQELISQNEIKPGINGATLTLSNGKQIALDEAGQGKLSEEAGISISKSKDGLLIYEVKSESGTDDKKHLNTLATARGESFLMILPDKSKVWLNADSRLVFDANMNHSAIRKVQLEGEAYFEVAKVKKPFIVETGKQEIQVLGTVFNVKAYPSDLLTKTTLVEGRVSVKSAGQNLMLQPGEMAIASHSSLKKQQVDISEEIAWKEGNFIFTNEKLSEILKVIGRWYNIDFVFVDEQLQEETFEAMFPKTIPIQDILNVLQSTGKVKFEIKNRTAYVKK